MKVQILGSGVERRMLTAALLAAGVDIGNDWPYEPKEKVYKKWTRTNVLERKAENRKKTKKERRLKKKRGY